MIKHIFCAPYWLGREIFNTHIISVKKRRSLFLSYSFFFVWSLFMQTYQCLSLNWISWIHNWFYYQNVKMKYFASFLLSNLWLCIVSPFEFFFLLLLYSYLMFIQICLWIVFPDFMKTWNMHCILFEEIIVSFVVTLNVCGTVVIHRYKICGKIWCSEFD